MNKKGLMSSLMALALVLSVGACSKEDKDDTNLEESSSGSSTENPYIEPEPKELTSYTVNFIFTGNVIPDYATVYIIGNWDDFGKFIALDKKDDTFSHTFSQITEGTYKYKAVMWYSDEDVSWTNCVEIITAENGKDYATLVISASDGESQTITSELIAYLEAPLTDEEIIELILESASQVNKSGLTSFWSALHAEVISKSDNTNDSAYLTNQSGFAYGYWHSENYGLETTTDKYYIEGIVYEHEVDDDLETDEYKTYDSSATYESLYENSLDFHEVFDVVEEILNVAEENNESIENNLSKYTISLEKSGTYSLTISASDDYGTYTYVYRDDSNFNLIAFSYSNTDENDGKEYKTEKNSASDISKVMENFDSKYWNPLYQGANATNPAELVEKAALTGNYSVQIKYDTYTSNNTITSEEYNLAMQGDEEALEEYYALETDISLTTSYILDIYYMDDCMYVVEKIFDEDDYYNLMIVVVINADDGLWEYWTSNGTSWSYYSADMYKSLGITHWQQAFYSLNDAYNTGLLDNLEYNSDYEAYDFNDWTFSWYYGYQSVSAAYWFCYLGGDWLFDAYAYYEAYYNFVHYFTYFSEEYQELMAWYCYPYLSYTDYSYSELYFAEEDIYMTVYDVGDTDMRDLCYYYHEGLQQVINGSN